MPPASRRNQDGIRPMSKLKTIIPMAGCGQRFVDVGYVAPKPFLLVDGKRMIDRVLESFPSDEHDFVFVCSQAITPTDENYLRATYPAAKVVKIPPHKLGPVHTTMQAELYIDDNAPLFVLYCDTAFAPFDLEKFRRHVYGYELDGCLLTHTGFHPHAEGETKMAFVLADGPLVDRVKEKQAFTADPSSEHASSGAYWFRNGGQAKAYFRTMLADRKEAYNGEYYVTLAYNLMIRDGLRVGYFDTGQIAVLGTPNDVRSFEAWAQILRGDQRVTEENAGEFVRYWKKWHEQEKAK
jgi:NDP-sugar pyrophosphorylase family protein